MSVAAGWFHTLALRTDGTVVGFGYNGSGQINVPAGLANATAIAAGWGHSLALRDDGTVVAWGLNSAGQCNVPMNLSNVTAIAAGYEGSVAVKSDGTIGWGWNAYGQASVPNGLDNVLGIATGPFRSVALKSDGTIVSWGLAQFGETNTPALFQKPIAISAGVGHNVVLDRPSPELTIQLAPLAKLRIGWPANRTGWQLQQSGSLIHEDWINASEQPVDLGLSFEVSLSPLAGPRYFRLSKEGL